MFNKRIKTITNQEYRFRYRFITNPFAKLGNRLRPNEVTKYVQMRKFELNNNGICVVFGLRKIPWDYIPTNREYTPRGYLKNYAGGPVSRPGSLAKGRACQKTWVPRESKGRQKTRLKPRRMPPLEMPG